MKQRPADKARRPELVAPRAGAWIETLKTTIGQSHLRSPPARGRGLKHVYPLSNSCECESPPARGRGLKQMPEPSPGSCRCRPPRGGVD